MISPSVIYVIERRRRGKRYLYWHRETVCPNLSSDEANQFALRLQKDEQLFDYRAVPYHRQEPSND